MPVSIRSDYPLGTARGCTCYTCGADRPGEPVVDWHLFIDGEGQLRQCASCVIEAAGLLGMIHPEARDEAIASMHEVQRAADDALAEAAEARALVASMRGWDEKHSASSVAPMPDPYEVSAQRINGQSARKPRKMPTERVIK